MGPTPSHRDRCRGVVNPYGVQRCSLPTVADPYGVLALTRRSFLAALILRREELDGTTSSLGSTHCRLRIGGNQNPVLQSFVLVGTESGPSARIALPVLRRIIAVREPVFAGGAALHRFGLR